MSEQIVNKAVQLSEEVVAIVHNDVLKGQLQIPKENKHEGCKQKKQKIKIETWDEKKLHEMIKRRKCLEEEIERIKLQQDEFKERRMPLMKQSQQGKGKNFRSSISLQERSRIHSILRETKKFEQEIHRKNNEIYEQMKKMNEREKKVRKTKICQQNEEKRKQINQKLKELQLRKIKRTQQIEQRNKEFHKVLKQKFLHQKIQEKWLALDQQLEEQNKKLLDKMKEGKKFQSQSIKDHQSKYLQLTIQNKKKREEMLEKSKNQSFEKQKLVNYGYSSFLTKINEEEEEKLRNTIKNVMKNEVRKVKKENYSQRIRQKNRNQIKAQKSVQLTQRVQSNLSASRSLDNLALNKLGNHYMRQIHSSIDETMRNSNRKLPSIHKVSQHQAKYPNYLSKVREEKKKQNPEVGHREMIELKKVMNSKEEDDTVKLQKTKNIINKMDESYIKSDKKLINLIKAKIDVINHFKDCQ